MKTVQNKVAAITGAGSGIGQALAKLLSSNGCHVAISDINESGLEQTKQACELNGVKVHSQRLDVADQKAVYAWAETVNNHFGKVNMIFNNAGVGLGATVEDMQYEDFNWLFNINFWGVVYGTKAFLPFLKSAGEGHIVNISSVFGIISVPTQSAYNASKFAVRGFTDALREELDIEQCGVSATTIHPGGIKTNIAKDARLKVSPKWLNGRDPGKDFEKLALTTPEQAANIIYNGMMQNKRRVLVGADAKVIEGMQRLAPGIYQKLLIVGAKKGLKV